MQDQLNQLLTNQNAGEVNSSAPVKDRRPRSLSPRRVHFDDERQQSSDDNCRSRYEDDRHIDGYYGRPM